MSETVKELLFQNGKPIEEYFFFVESCPLCDSKRLKTLFRQWGIGYYRCRECEFVFSNPRLTNKGAYRWYNSDYYNAAMQTEHYIAENYSKYYSISLGEYYFKKTMQFFEGKDFPHDIIIADLGCGSGAILQYLKDELGFGYVKGFDLNTANIEFAKRFRGLEVENKDIYDLVEKEKFDVVITTENIEHVSQPIDYIKQIKKLVKPGGHLLLTTPHNDKKATNLMGLSGDHFCAPNHQNYFNYQNLYTLIESHGFKVIDYRINNQTQFNLYAFLKRSFISRDQATAFPPIKVSLKTIWKWQRNRDKSVITSSYNNISLDQIDSGISNHLENVSLKKRIKKFMSSIIPLYFRTHQILLAKYNREN